MQLLIHKKNPAYWRVTIHNPPINLFDPETVNELTSLVEILENDERVKVVVFDSGDNDFFFSHVDLLRAGEFDLTPRASGLPGWPDVARRFETGNFISIGVLRGRARGVGSEFLQALDMRFASKQRALLSQVEVGCGAVPGGGGLERLPYLVGKGRALEIILSSQDYDADTAEKYGWINRSVDDSQLDAFVDDLATRISGFDKTPLIAAKKIIYKRLGLAPVDDFKETQKIFFDAIASPATQERLKKLFELGLQQTGDTELNLPTVLGTLTSIE